MGNVADNRSRSDPRTELAQVLADVQNPHVSLRRVCEIVRDHTHSHGAKVYVVVPDVASPTGIALLLLDRTDAHVAPRKVIHVAGNRGLGDWVYCNDDWLLIPDAVDAERAGQDPERAITGRHKIQFIVAYREAEHLGNASGETAMKDDERSMLLVPLHRKGKVAGVLAIWRRTGPAYHPRRDSKNLLDLAPHVVSACLGVLRLEGAQEEIDAMREVAEKVTASTTLANAHKAVLAAACKVARAPAAILLHHDSEHAGYLYSGRGWAVANDKRSMLAPLGGLRLDVGADRLRWLEAIRSAMRSPEGADMDTHLQHLLSFPAPPGGVSAGAIGILSTRTDLPFLVINEEQRPLRSFMRYADQVLRTHVTLHAKHLAERIAVKTGSDREPRAALLRTARELQQVTDADVALIYTEDRNGWALGAWTHPDRRPPVLRVRPESLTYQSIREGKPRRVLDMGDPSEGARLALDLEETRLVLDSLGWSGATSWVCWPVVHEGRCFGAIKVMTQDCGRFLSAEHVALGVELVERVAWEIHKTNRGVMLERLNQLATDLASLSGDVLASTMVVRLRDWFDQFLRPGCEVAVVARNQPDRILLSRGSSGLEKETIESFERLSLALDKDPQTPVQVGSKACIECPISLPQSSLRGHIFVRHSHPFGRHAHEVVKEAAREMAVVLNSERYHQEFILGAGMFRHALLGPVQGLADAAKMLAVHAAAANAQDVEHLKGRIDKETEIIRLWRENQRLYMGGQVMTKPRSQALRPIVDLCANRYREALQIRGLRLSVAWGLRGEIIFSFDSEALDLALSNLLDNARKYSFYGREVTLGVDVEGAFVRIWVEDIGHPIPERLQKDIYLWGKRMDWVDPFRIIRGDGLGLPMARAVIEAQDGNLYHSCEQAGSSADEKTIPFKVRFTIELPHYWKDPSRRKHD